MRISLIHQSRGRPQLAHSNYRNWIDKSEAHNSETSDITIEHILSLDVDEPKYCEYVELFGVYHHMVQENPQDGYVVGATNAAAKYTTGDVLIYLSDDFDCPEKWDKLIMDKMNPGIPQILKVDDCLLPMGAAILTIPIMTREFYDKFGYFFYPEYKSMFCDEDLYNVARILDALVIAPDLKFPHRHPSNGKKEFRGKNDETYKRSYAMMKQGRVLHNNRRKANYGL